LRTTPGIPATVRVSRKKIGVVFALIGAFAVVVGWWGGWVAGWLTTLVFLPIMLVLAVLFYSGVSRESNVSVARGYVSVYPRTIGNETTALSESTCKPESVKEEGDVVLVFSRWSQLRIVFQDETEKASFISEVSALVKR
jgi:hypothetical protein